MSRVGPLLAVALGGALGALARWGLLEWLPDERQAVVLFGCNVAGSLLVGVLAGNRERFPTWWYRLFGTGFAGGFTTFSAYALDVAQRLDAGAIGAATLSGLATPLAAVLAAGTSDSQARRAGVALLRRPGRRRRRSETGRRG